MTKTSIDAIAGGTNKALVLGNMLRNSYHLVVTMVVTQQANVWAVPFTNSLTEWGK